MNFNPAAQPQVIEFAPEALAVVVDDALVDPTGWKTFATTHARNFAPAQANAYPGRQLEAPASIADALDDFFATRVRRILGGRRTLRTRCRFAIVDRAPNELEPRQTICHRDTAWVDPAELNAASVLYLFADRNLGGTDFYRPLMTEREIARLVHDSGTLSANDFHARYGIERTYMTESNRYFAHIGRVEAAWNRLVFYDGGIFHSGAISPKVWSDSRIAEGRLTINGFFTCSRVAR